MRSKVYPACPVKRGACFSGVELLAKSTRRDSTGAYLTGVAKNPSCPSVAHGKQIYLTELTEPAGVSQKKHALSLCALRETLYI